MKNSGRQNATTELMITNSVMNTYPAGLLK